MSKLALTGNNSGSGTFTLTSPDSNTNRTVTLPDATATLAGVNVAQSFTAGQRGAVVALVDGATITPDFAAGNNFSVTLGGSRTLANPTNIVAGQSGSLFISQDATGGRTLAYGSFWDFAGGTAPSLTTGANAVDRIDYIVRSSTSIQAGFTGNYS